MAVGEVQLRQAVEKLHECAATFREVEQVREEFDGELVWEGEVYVFDLLDHPRASVAYAWAHFVDDTKKLKFNTVLQVPPVETAADAVRAAIVKDYQEGRDAEV